jgi:hypothetical protein
LTYELFDPVPRNTKIYASSAASEKTNPKPSAEVIKKDKKQRVSFLQKSIDQLHMVVPHFQNIHEVGADLPEECMMSIGCDLPMLFSTFHVLIANADVSFKWMSGAAYKNYRKVLQLLEWQDEEQGLETGKRWTLKCPVHLGLLEFLGEGFPDATIVWTHRKPTEAIGSLASFVRATQDMHEGSAEGINLEGLGQNVRHFGNSWIKRADDFLQNPRNKNHKRANIMYTQLIKDPIKTIKALYAEVGYEFTGEYEQKLREYIEANNAEREALKKKGGAGKGKVQSYDLMDFGLTDEIIASDLDWYSKKYFK